ncbi:hypothetical protein G3554_20390 [Micromonospora sp. PPF5-17]|uniref:Uncharacterized protein n=1 Tax=Micromonospora solifontis TaxID=2487138 RepID=A0ABX9WEA6_9ACTN|nr:hypothetical protein [Micromonospora solifontis]RNL95326.1 hypothetical protein EFE23_20475 [Micromonospora solifontis]
MGEPLGVGSAPGPADGLAVADGSPTGSENVLVGSAVAVGVGSGVADAEADGDGTGDGDGELPGGVRVAPGVGVPGGTAGRGRHPEARSESSGRAGAAGTSRGAATGRLVAAGPAAGVRVGPIAGWLPLGRATTTGPTEGVGMNGVPLSGRALLPTVAEPALIAARIGMEAVPASSATVNR